MDRSEQERLIEHYRRLFLLHGEGPAVGQWSAEGQRFRFQKLAQVASLEGRKVLDLGCGIGDLYPFLRAMHGHVEYTGVDVVPELINYASRKYPSARFICADVSSDAPAEKFDYVLISGVFNNRMSAGTARLKEIIRTAFALCEHGLAFNFISDRVDTIDPEMAYHDPVDVFRYCLAELSNKVVVAHHYERRDVAIYVYR